MFPHLSFNAALGVVCTTGGVSIPFAKNPEGCKAALGTTTDVYSFTAAPIIATAQFAPLPRSSSLAYHAPDGLRIEQTTGDLRNSITLTIPLTLLAMKVGVRQLLGIDAKDVFGDNLATLIGTTLFEDPSLSVESRDGLVCMTFNPQGKEGVNRNDSQLLNKIIYLFQTLHEDIPFDSCGRSAMGDYEIELEWNGSMYATFEEHISLNFLKQCARIFDLEGRVLLDGSFCGRFPHFWLIRVIFALIKEAYPTFDVTKLSVPKVACFVRECLSIEKSEAMKTHYWAVFRNAVSGYYGTMGLLRETLTSYKDGDAEVVVSFSKLPEYAPKSFFLPKPSLDFLRLLTEEPIE